MRFSFTFFCFCLYFIGSGSTYFVSPEGLNGASGTMSDPYYLLQEAIDQCSSGNDTVYLFEGIYWQSLNISEKEGIYLSSFNPDAPATLSGSGVEAAVLITIQHSNQIYIANIIFREKFAQDAKAIHAFGEGNGLYIIDNIFFNIGWTDDPSADPELANPVGQAHAILINGRNEAGFRNVYIGRNHLHDIIPGNSEGITLTGNTYDFLIEDNLVEDITNIGIDIAGHFSWAFPPELDQNLNQARGGRISNNILRRCRRVTAGNEPAGIYVDGGKNVIIDNNLVYDNGTGISVGCENFNVSASDVQVVGNLIYGNDRFGLVFGANAGVIDQSVARNNTFFNNGIFFDNSGSISLQKSSTSAILNNIVYVSSEDYFGLSLFGFVVTSLEINHNLFYSPDGNTPRVFAFNPGVGSSSDWEPPIFADPIFTSPEPAEPDFHLQAGSPAIDAGSEDIAMIPMETDMDGMLRQAEGIDIGAYESGFTTSLPDIEPRNYSIYPNPSRGGITVDWKQDVKPIYLRIMDASGRAVHTEKNITNGKTLFLSIPTGLYVVELEFEGGERKCVKWVRE